MKIVFFGTSEFAIPALKRLIESRHKVLAVVTQPDRKKGRSLVLSKPPTKVVAESRKIPVYQPLDASGGESISYLKRMDADLFVVISFGQILKKEALAIPKLYSINLHGSLLPKYRGAAPTNWAIINGERSTGVTVIRMNERMDEGELILSEEVGISAEDTNITLSETLSDLGASLLLKAVDLIDSGKAVNFIKQDPAFATYAPKLKKEDGLIDWRESAAGIHNKVRGMLPWPGAYTHYDGKVLKILKTELIDTKLHPGGVIGIHPGGVIGIHPGGVIGVFKDRGIAVQTGDGVLAIRYLQLEGKKILDSDAFVRGHKIEKGYSFVL